MTTTTTDRPRQIIPRVSVVIRKEDVTAKPLVSGPDPTLAHFTLGGVDFIAQDGVDADDLAELLASYVDALRDVQRATDAIAEKITAESKVDAA